MLMSSCGGDADNFTDFGLDAVTQQVSDLGGSRYLGILAMLVHLQALIMSAISG